MRYLMNSWRVTKYNPKYRDNNGFYTRANQEWYLYSQIGEIYNGTKFTYSEYKKVEDAYVNAILYFMRDTGLNTLQIVGLSKNKKLEKTKHNSQKMIQVIKPLKEQSIVNMNDIKYITRWNLRDDSLFGCHFQSQDMFIHFGWDYYMYIGSTKECKDAIAKTEALGLFVEPMESPYLNNE